MLEECSLHFEANLKFEKFFIFNVIVVLNVMYFNVDPKTLVNKFCDKL